MNSFKRRKRGFSLLEAVLSTALLGVMLVIIFSVLHYFSKAVIKEESQQDINRQFLKAYDTVNSDLSVSSTKVFLSYNDVDYPQFEKNRWFVFLSPLDKNHTGHWTSAGIPVYQQMILFYLIRPDGDTCQSLEACPHKLLIKKSAYADGAFVMLRDVIELDENNNIIGGLVTNLDRHIASPSALDSLFTAKTVEKEVYDLTVESIDHVIMFKMTSVKIEEARRMMVFGQRTLSPPPPEVKRFFVEQSWYTTTRNY